MGRITKSVLFMFVTTLIFTSLVTGVKILNQDRIQRNREAKLQETVLDVLGLNTKNLRTPEEISILYKNRIKQKKLAGRIIYVCHAEDGKTVTGYAFPVDGPGFWGAVYAMVAIDPGATRILGVSFYSHSETPGLGGRISEPWFTGQFKDLSLALGENEKQYFYLVPEGDRKRKNDLDAITGASRTSDAVETFLNREVRIVVKEIIHAKEAYK